MPTLQSSRAMSPNRAVPFDALFPRERFSLYTAVFVSQRALRFQRALSVRALLVRVEALRGGEQCVVRIVGMAELQRLFFIFTGRLCRIAPTLKSVCDRCSGLLYAHSFMVHWCKKATFSTSTVTVVLFQCVRRVVSCNFLAASACFWLQMFAFLFLTCLK